MSVGQGERNRCLVRRLRPLSSVGIVATLSLLGLSGCTHHPSPATAAPHIAGGAHTVPALSPDYLPDSLFTALGIVRGESDTAMFMVRSIVKVLFKDGTAQRERQQAIDLIGGVVVGGARVTDDGDYYVRIPGSTTRDIQTAVRRLAGIAADIYGSSLFRRPPGGSSAVINATRQLPSDCVAPRNILRLVANS